MVDISKTLISKSDQFNAVDLLGKVIIYKISKVNADIEKKDQPVSIYFEGEKKCYRPSKGMRAIISEKWTTQTDLWLGKSLELYYEPKVVYAGAECGGIRIHGMSHIDNDFKKRVVESKVLQINYKIRKLQEQVKNDTLAPSQKILDAIDKCITEISAFVDIEEIGHFLSSEKYAWVKKQNADLLKRVDDALQNKQNELNGV
jgi:hypothetical protein